MRNDKHYVSAKATFDQALADQFKLPTADKQDEKKDAAKEAEAAQSANKNDTNSANISEEANSINTRVSGWVYEIPQYKYDAIFKTLDSLVKK